MGRVDFRRILKLSFPLAFAFGYTLFYVLMVGSLPVLAMNLPPVFWLIGLFSIVYVPFAIYGFANPAIFIMGAVLVALLSGAVQYAYGNRLTGDWRWQLCLIILVTWVQCGLLLAVSSLILRWSVH